MQRNDTAVTLIENMQRNDTAVTLIENEVEGRRPKVSILLITYNHEKYIAQAIESVLMQETEYSFEINVIEDCSTDKTQEIVMRYVDRYPGVVKPYFNEKNIGSKVTQKNFYRGFFTMTGEYLAILEGDDYWTSPHKLQKQISFLESHREFAICACNTVKVYEDNSREPHRFLYYGRQDDSTIEDVINLRCFFHTTGVMYRNVFNGVPPRQYRNKWSCDIFIMISHAEFGKVRHLDEDMAVYRAHGGGMFSNMPLLEGWFFNIDGLRRYNRWLGYRHCRAFAESIARYCRHVLAEAGKGEAAPLSWYRFVKLWLIRIAYTVIYGTLSLPHLLRTLPRQVKARLFLLLNPETRVSELAELVPNAEWHFLWGLNIRPRGDSPFVAGQRTLQLTAVSSNAPDAADRHAFCLCFDGFIAAPAYRIVFWVRTGELDVHLQVRDLDTEHVGEVAFNLSSRSIRSVKGDMRNPAIDEPDANGWYKLSADFLAKHNVVYAYVGLVKRTPRTHVFKPAAERLLLGGIDARPVGDR